MLYQEDDPELDDECMTDGERLTKFIKSREKIVVRIKGAESSSVQGPQYYEECLFVRERVSRRTERISVREPGKDGNHAPIGQAQNDSFIDISKEISVSMDNKRPEGAGNKSVIYPSG